MEDRSRACVFYRALWTDRLAVEASTSGAVLFVPAGRRCARI